MKTSTILWIVGGIALFLYFKQKSGGNTNATLTAGGTPNDSVPGVDLSEIGIAGG